MRIKMLTTSAGPDPALNWRRNQIRNVPESEAVEMVTTGIAEPVDRMPLSFVPPPKKDPVYFVQQVGTGKKTRWSVSGPDGVVAENMTEEQALALAGRMDGVFA